MKGRTQGSPLRRALLNVLYWALPKPTYFFPERTHVRQKQTSLLLLSLNRSFVLTQEKYAKEGPNGSAYARHSSNKFGSALA